MTTDLSPQLQEATQSLIEHLLASETFKRYQQAHTRINEDSESRTLMERLSSSQANIRQKQASGGVGQEELDALRLLQQRVLRDPVIMDYAQSQQEVIGLLRQINGEISQLLAFNFASFANHTTC